MGNSALLTLKSDLEFLRKDCSHVVGNQDSVTTAFQQALLARHPDVGVGNWENASITVGGAVYSTGGTACYIDDLMAGQERSKMFLCTNGSNSGSTPTMGNRKGLVQVEMSNISSDFAGTGKTHLCIHVCTVKINLPAMLVNKVADFLYCIFEHAKCRWIRDHNSRQFFAVLSQLSFKVIHVDEA